VVGVRGKWSEGGVTAGTEPERNTADGPPTEARRFCGNKIPLTTSAREVRAARTKGARSNGARVGRGGHHWFG